MTLTHQQYNARCAFLRFQAAYLSLREEFKYTLPLELHAPLLRMEAACCDFFAAANEHLFEKPGQLAKPRGENR